jgi:hypothetical protein
MKPKFSSIGQSETLAALANRPRDPAAQVACQKVLAEAVSSDPKFASEVEQELQESDSQSLVLGKDKAKITWSWEQIVGGTVNVMDYFTELQNPYYGWSAEEILARDKRSCPVERERVSSISYLRADMTPTEKNSYVFRAHRRLPNPLFPDDRYTDFPAFGRCQSGHLWRVFDDSPPLPT